MSYNDLVNNVDLSASVSEAFGASDHCLGLLIVKDLPEHFAKLRERTLLLASTFAALPDNVKERSVHEPSHFSFGWSCGKETMNGKPDYLKGSFYANPITDTPEATDAELREYVMYTHPNIWPSAEDCPGYEEAFKELGQFIVGVGGHVAKACDNFVAGIIANKATSETPRQGYLTQLVARNQTVKGRLLHYFPLPEENLQNGSSEALDSWCGTHLDHSTLTGLTSAIFFDESDPRNPIPIPNPDPTAGLYIKDRAGNLHHAKIPADCLAFQTGEALEIVTNGALRATPHFVRGISSKVAKEIGQPIARNTMAIFMQPNISDVLDEKTGLTFGQFTKEVLKRHYEG